MAENLQFNENSVVVGLRSLPAGTHLIGVADEEIQMGDFVTFDHQDTTGIYRVRKLTFEETLLMTTGELTSTHIVNRVERIARAVRHANIEETIEFIIDQHCEHIAAVDLAHYPGLSSPKKHEMDEDYPHKCFNPKCKKDLKYLEAWKEVKGTGMTEKKFKKLWELEEIEFYCCSCYNAEMRKQKPSSFNLLTPFPNVGRDFFEIIRRAREEAARRWSGPLGLNAILPPATLFPQVLQQIRWHATHILDPFIITIDAPETHRTVNQFRFDIRVTEDLDREIVFRLNTVITAQHQERYNNIPPVLDLTLQVPQIRSEGTARLVAEAAFHWMTALVFLHENEQEWIPLDQRPEILRITEGIVDQINRGEDLVGEAANERFHQVYPNYPHIWDESYTCELCGLTRIEIDQAQGIQSGHLGWHREYEFSMALLEPNRVNVFGGLAEQNEWINEYLHGPHEHVYEGRSDELFCQICGRRSVDIDAERSYREAIQRRGSLTR